MDILKNFIGIKLWAGVAIPVAVVIIMVGIAKRGNESKNAIIKENMSAILANARVYYDSYGNYMNFQHDAGYTGPAAIVQSANGGVSPTYGLNTVTGSWCACSTLKITRSESGTFCVDSGKHKVATKTACATRCASGAGETTGACQP